MSFKKITSSILKNIPVIGLLTIFVSIQFQNLNADFWNDEIYTLKHFTFTSIRTTLFNYHVPNNHIFFNLINNLYLKAIHVTSLHELMETPYKLRIIPLIYALLTLVLTFKTANRFYSKTTALLTVVILMTTLPFYYFSLQIRGYGLSMFLLVTTVYYGLLFLKSSNHFHLLLVVLFTALLGYTVPSNLYFLFSFTLALVVLLGYKLLQKKTTPHPISVKNILLDANFQLISALTIGVITTLILYSPIFKDVFMNEYVKPGESFNLVKLEFYLPHLIEGFVSGKWILIIASGLGYVTYLFKTRKLSTHTYLIASIILIPILLVYVRGDRAPLRIFTVLLPFTSLLIAAGINHLWSSIKQTNSIHNHFLVFAVLGYSLLIFNVEDTQSSNSVLKDIQTEGRSQDLYRQYYSHHYQPLKDLTNFKSTYLENKLPIVISGCEPHGLPNYLEKLGLPYFLESSLDSVLIENDSVYIITNHQSKFSKLEEFNTIQTQPDLTYHNTLLFGKKPIIEVAEKQLRAFANQYGDSIRFVFDTYSPLMYTSHLDPKSVFYISDNTRLGELITFTHQATYLLYFEAKTNNSAQAIIHNQHTTTESVNYSNFGIVTLLKRDSSTLNQPKPVEKINLDNQYSNIKAYHVKSSTTNLHFTVSLNAKFTQNTSGLIVLTMKRNDESMVWKSIDLMDYYQSNTESQRVIATFNLNSDFKPGDIIKTYIWNPHKESVWISDLSIEDQDL